MSHAATNWAIQQRGLKPVAKILLWHLADCHNPVAGCFPTQSYLAEQCEISRASVNCYLAELEQVGIIRRDQQIDPTSKRQRPTRYFLAFEDGFRPLDVVARVSVLDTGAVSQISPSRVSNSAAAVSQSSETLTCKGTSKEPMEADGVFESLFERFPRRPGSTRIPARRAFDAVDQLEWPLLIAAVERQRQLFEADCKTRGQREDERSHFAPFMANWIKEGGWRELGRQGGANQRAEDDLVVAGPGDPEFEAVYRLRGKRPILGKSGRTTFSRAEVDQAMRGAA